jgi:hypothetical protein
VTTKDWQKKEAATARRRKKAHLTVLKLVKELDCDDHYKDFMRYRLGTVPTVSEYTRPAKMGVAWHEHAHLFRSHPPEFLCRSDIDRGLQAAVRDINASGWVATEWCCAGHAKDIRSKPRRHTHCYLCLLIREQDAGRFIRLVQQARKETDSPAVDLTPRDFKTELVNDYIQNDMGGTGFLRITLEHYSESMKTVYLWRKFVKHLGKLLVSDNPWYNHEQLRGSGEAQNDGAKSASAARTRSRSNGKPSTSPQGSRMPSGNRKVPADPTSTTPR